jgi:hypothetical protein
MTYSLREQSIGEMIWNSFSIYVRYFPIFFTYFLLLLPINVLYGIFFYMEENEWLKGLLSFSIYVVISTLTEAIFTILISDIYLGNKPSLLRSCKQVFKPVVIRKLLLAVLFILIIINGSYSFTWQSYHNYITVQNQDEI